jgi:hypothetical protein
MDYKRYRHIPRALFDTITFLAQALPKRSVPTFLELLFGAMLTQTGFVTNAYLAVNSIRHWNSYYKWLHFGKWSWVTLALTVSKGFRSLGIPILSRLARRGGVVDPLVKTIIC